MYKPLLIIIFPVIALQFLLVSHNAQYGNTVAALDKHIVSLEQANSQTMAAIWSRNSLAYLSTEAHKRNLSPLLIDYSNRLALKR